MKENDDKIIDNDVLSNDLKGALKLDSFYETRKQTKNKSIIIGIISGILIFLLISIAVLLVINSINSNNKLNNFKEMTEPVLVEMEPKVENLILNTVNVNLDRAYGKIEIIWLDKENRQIDKPLKPILNDLIPVKYDKNNYKFVRTVDKDADWYDYDNKMWANAINKDNSYFVWIPRFAYKIIYYEDSSYKNISGYSDARGILKVSDNDKNTFLKIAEPNKGLVSVGNNYILHPAFMNDKINEYINGGNDFETSGFWIAKYESSLETSEIRLIAQTTDVLASDKILLSSKPAKRSWRDISVKNAYINAFNYDRNNDSHLVKISEWGAVAYLSFSKYGTNGANLSINDNENYITGGIDNEEDVYKIKYIQTSNRNQTGVYDLSGGVSEYLAAYIPNNSPNIYINGGNGLTDIGGDRFNSRYKNVYKFAVTDTGNSDIETVDYNINNYYANSKQRGDALWETSNFGAINSGWFYNSSVFPIGSHPFMIRGGSVKDGIKSGLFNFNNSDGKASDSTGFRIALNVNK